MVIQNCVPVVDLTVHLKSNIYSHADAYDTRHAMTSIGTGYDLSASTYSPDGRIFQVSRFVPCPRISDQWKADLTGRIRE